MGRLDAAGPPVRFAIGALQGDSEILRGWPAAIFEIMDGKRLIDTAGRRPSFLSDRWSFFRPAFEREGSQPEVDDPESKTGGCQDLQAQEQTHRGAVGQE